MSLKEWFFGSEHPGTEKSVQSVPEKPRTNPVRKDTKPNPVRKDTKPARKESVGKPRSAQHPDSTKASITKEYKPDKGAEKTSEKSAASASAGGKPPEQPEKGPKNPFKSSANAPVVPGEVEQTQILTKEELLGLSAKDKDGGSGGEPVKFVPPEKKDAKPAEPQDKLEAEKPSPAPQPAPLPKAATWKVLPVKEPWAPEAVTKEFPALERYNYFDHEAFERIVSDDWRVIGASRRGRKQAHDSRFREDAIAFGCTPELTVLVVADGAGSSKYSRIGSHVAVHAVVDECIKGFGDFKEEDKQDAKKLEEALSKLLTASVKQARTDAVEVAEKSELNPKDFRATLLTIIHCHVGEIEFLLSNQVGDGAISLLLKDKSVKKFGHSDGGEFSGEVSCFLTDSAAVEKAGNIQVHTDVKNVEAMFLCSDGIEDPFYPIDKKADDIFRQWHVGVDDPLDGFKVQPKQEAVFAEEAAAGALAHWLEFEKRGENDDRTILVMHRHPSTVQY